ncbi:hypothetical protein L798_01546 [Zootermopsis nevadensis]|uniref:Uncharacterized protein n=1 Tax=Zootermopsis nevadensis TaxID=136037 RepID=A0A067QT26_ZOONE|nr:hypothetical protein L798_01546 [Zootermopsis nevadensis]
MGRACSPHEREEKCIVFCLSLGTYFRGDTRTILMGGSSPLSVRKGKELPVSVSVRNSSLRTCPCVLLTFGRHIEDLYDTSGSSSSQKGGILLPVTSC